MVQELQLRASERPRDSCIGQLGRIAVCCTNGTSESSSTAIGQEGATAVAQNELNDPFGLRPEYAADVNYFTATDWEELAGRGAYFGVLTHDGAVATNQTHDPASAFFETGEADISTLLAAIGSLVGRELSLTSTLDFGCGVGRLTVPLARRSTTVVACDVSPTMLAHARQNVQDASLRNVTFTGTSELTDLPANKFDFICSLLVLQYIPMCVGLPIIRTLLRVLAPGGLAALHVVLARPSAKRSRLATILSSMPRLKRPRVDSAPRMAAGLRIYRYALQTIAGEISCAGAHLLGRFPADAAGAVGAVLIVQK
jgi:SAM-dependent methyltransferase